MLKLPIRQDLLQTAALVPGLEHPLELFALLRGDVRAMPSQNIADPPIPAKFLVPKGDGQVAGVILLVPTPVPGFAGQKSRRSRHVPHSVVLALDTLLAAAGAGLLDPPVEEPLVETKLQRINYRSAGAAGVFQTLRRHDLVHDFCSAHLLTLVGVHLDVQLFLELLGRLLISTF